MKGLRLPWLAVFCLLPPAAAQQPDGDTSAIFMEAIVEERPALLSAPKVKYPTTLKNAGVEGQVIVQAVIDTTGRAVPSTVKVLQSPNPGFDDAARDYVEKAMFRPARIHGRAVRVLMQVRVAFRAKS